MPSRGMSMHSAPLFLRNDGNPDPQSERSYHRLATVRSTTVIRSRLEEIPRPYLGRLTPYYDLSHRVFARWIASETVNFQRVRGQRIGDVTTQLSNLSLTMVQSSSGRILYMVTVDFTSSSGELFKFLEDFYYESVQVVTGGEELTLPQVVARFMARTTLGGDEWHRTPEIHQLLYVSSHLCGDVLGRTLAGELEYNQDFLISLVYRIGARLRKGFTSVLFPPELNRGMGVLGAVGSFVSVLSGHQEYVENAVLLSVIQVLAATSELRAIENSIAGSYDLVRDQLDALGRGDRRLILQKLTAELALHEMSLSEFVESATDVGLWIPALRVEDFHRSLVQSVRLMERANLVSTSVTRLTAIVAARAQVLSGEEQQLQDHRRRSWALVAAILSSVAVPIGLVLAFFGISASNVDPDSSIFDFRLYAGLYLFIGGLIVLSVLVVVGFYVLGHPERRK